MAKKTFDHEFDAEFSTVGIGAEKVRIGIKCDRADVDPDVAEELFCGAQIDVELDCDPNSKKDVDGQTTIEGTALKFAGTADVKRYSTTPDQYGASLQFSKSAVDLTILGKFSSCKGKIRATRIGAIETDGDDEGDE